MPDLEKVIRGLEICFEHGLWRGLDCIHNEAYKDCPYYGCETGCVVTIAKDALVLLKEQEAIVRCKDCQNGEPAFDGKLTRCKLRGLRKLDWYCADGEHKEM